MDGARFDAFSRSFGQPSTRRRFLGGVIAGIAALRGLDTSEAAACRAPAQTCGSNGDCCSGLCGPKDSRGRRSCLCASAADCRQTSESCMAAVCSSGGICGIAPDVGRSCDDGNLCTSNTTCQADGSCGGGEPVPCSGTNVCLNYSCDPAVGCVTSPKDSGTLCSDGNACNGTERCDGNGNCLSDGLSITCATCEVCDPSDGSCNPDASQNGNTCIPAPGANLCFESFECNNGACAGTTAISCPPPGVCYNAGTCEPTTGVCSINPKDDETPCTAVGGLAGTCQGGICITTALAGCQPEDNTCSATGTVTCGRFCGCFLTMDGATICGNMLTTSGDACSGCVTDADCAAGSFCVQGGPGCSCLNSPGATSCVELCPDPD